ncbi:hypothetical protein BZZ01_17310 [Nostocales cyanobacterium HT-58-2]|nr:hypothetical protein BZZ01_17310 [Nostocales cyanobacterium HT-58-2]
MSSYDRQLLCPTKGTQSTHETDIRSERKTQAPLRIAASPATPTSSSVNFVAQIFDLGGQPNLIATDILSSTSFCNITNITKERMPVFESLTVTKDGFAFDFATGESFMLNHCGQLVLQRLRHGETQQQIVQFLCSRFDIQQSIAERDIADFCQQLNALGLTEDN